MGKRHKCTRNLVNCWDGRVPGASDFAHARQHVHCKPCDTPKQRASLLEASVLRFSVVIRVCQVQERRAPSQLLRLNLASAFDKV